MVLFFDAVSKIYKDGIVYKNFDKNFIKNIFVDKINTNKPVKQIKNSIRADLRTEYLTDKKVNIERLVNAYKAYQCKIISKEQITEIRNGYYASKITNS